LIELTQDPKSAKAGAEMKAATVETKPMTKRFMLRSSTIREFSSTPRSIDAAIQARLKTSPCWLSVKDKGRLRH
jgi:hypothetical protein